MRQDRLDYSAQIYLVALMNSFVIDYIIRMQIKNHASQFILKKLPVIRRSRGDAVFEAIVNRGLRLICATNEFAELWELLTNSAWFPESVARGDIHRAQLMGEIEALVADLYGLSEEDFAYILTTFPLLDRDQPALPGEPKSFITRDLALLELFKLRGKIPPADVVEFFVVAGADITGITGPIRHLAERVKEATRLGAVAYVPSGRGGGGEEEKEVTEEDREESEFGQD